MVEYFDVFEEPSYIYDLDVFGCQHILVYWSSMQWIVLLISRGSVHVPKVDNFYLSTFLIASIFKWYIVLCGCKNEHPKGMCSQHIGLNVPNMIIIYGSILNIIEET